jgi:hypothetical protein
MSDSKDMETREKTRFDWCFADILTVYVVYVMYGLYRVHF